MIKPLIWKEWHEQRWKLAFGTVMLAFFTGSLIAVRLTTSNESIVAVLFFGGIILSLYSAMGVFAPERVAGTTTFLASKPIAAWKVFACKWFFGWLNFVVPMLVSVLCLQFAAFEWPTGSFLVRAMFASICLATMFYSMTCCFAPRNSSEAFVGFIGLIIFGVILVHLLIIQLTLIFGHGSGETVGKLGEVIICVNPAFWFSLILPKEFFLHNSILFIEQGILFIVVFLVGLRKWQRSS
ncbi:MAG: hypothetical protein ACYTFK_13045 [Planctomycetota bacterium]|jgi:ABC-type transport system involved in multi-copper enzyme maturation permease subunit